jgi:hypothetical protein
VRVPGDETYLSATPNLATFDLEKTPVKTKAKLRFGGHLPETRDEDC